MTYNNDVAILARVESIKDISINKKDGTLLPKKEIVAVIDNYNNPQFSQRLQLNAIGKVAELSLSINQNYLFSLNFKAFDFNGRTLNAINIWRISSADGNMIGSNTNYQAISKKEQTESQYYEKENDISDFGF